MVESGCSSWFECFVFLGVIKMSNDNISSRTGETKNTWQKKIKKIKMKIENSNVAETKEDYGINLDINGEINKLKKRMRIERRLVNMEEYNKNKNKLKPSNYNGYDYNSDVSRSSTAASSNSTFNSRVNTEKKLSFKNGLVQSLYKKFKGKCSTGKALDFFKSEEVPTSNFDTSFWAEILQVINLDNCTIEKLVKFKQNIVKLVNNQVGLFGRKMEPEKIKFAISPDMFQNLVYNSGGKIFVDYLGDEKHQECLNSFRIVLDGSNDDMGRESCGKLLNFILEDLEDNRQPIKNMIDLLQICRILLDRKTIPVNVDGWKKIFSKINSLSIKDFLNISSILDYPRIELDDLEKFLFRKLNSKDDTQDEVKPFIDVFFPNDKIKNEIKNDELDNRLYVFNLFVGSFPDKKLDFSFVTSFAKNNFGLELSNLSIESLIKLISKVKSDSIDSKVFQSLVETVKGKKILLGTKNDVDKLRQLLCDVLRISGKELGFSNVMDLFLLYPKMPGFCTKSTLTNESLKLALEKISAIVSSNKNLGGDKDKFRNKFKKFIELFEDNSNKITFNNFKNLILAVPDDFLDFDSINYLLEKTDTKEHQNNLCSFFESTLLKKISQYKFDLAHVHDFFDKYLSSKSVKNYKFKAETFKFIVANTIKSNNDRSCNNNDIEWLLQKCCDAGAKLEKDKFVNLIKKGKTEKISDDVAKIDWMNMNDFINKIVSPKSGFLDKRKIEFDKSELDCILSRTKFCFDESKLGDFLEKILTLKRFVTSDKLFAIVLNLIPLNGLPSLDVFRKVVYYCFEDVENYNSDRQIPVDCRHKIDFKLYNELLKTFQDNSLSYDDFKMLNSNFFNEQRSDSLLGLLFGLFNENKTNANVSNIDHTVLRKKLKRGTLSNKELDGVFSKFVDKKLPKDNFIEILMLAKDKALTKDDFINLFNNHCDDRIETESNDDELGQIAGKISNASKEDLRDCLVKLNVEKGINQLLNDIKKNFSILFKLTDQKLKEYGLSTLLNQGAQENNMRNNRQENIGDANYLQLNQNRREPLLNQNNEANNLNNVIQSAPNVVFEVVENLDEGKYGTRMSIIDFKTKYPDIWGGLDKEQRVYLQMILGYKQSLLLTIFCLFLSCVLFVPATTVTYCLGVFFIIYFLLKLTGERTRNRLTEMVQGKSREPSFWDRFFVWNKSIIENARALCQLGENRNQKDANNFYKETKDSILGIMLPEHVSFWNTASSFKDTALRMVNRVSSVFNRNVL